MTITRTILRFELSSFYTHNTTDFFSLKLKLNEHMAYISILDPREIVFDRKQTCTLDQDNNPPETDYKPVESTGCSCFQVG